MTTFNSIPHDYAPLFYVDKVLAKSSIVIGLKCSKNY
ncbi:unnamed protein product [Spirodela intermedia]|uniref:Uncharacterized protein n=2 Tax=Spirodela intermedia TaxID=51605 RepID=A0A7I8LLX5_SPIIN|nr:unnamed protein product [Spirodela intermedia]CAA6673387.1 unnamed protein product [Spirodela intermedia]CAA7410616.1 unnamed protein product [Spirodela intermedia]